MAIERKFSGGFREDLGEGKGYTHILEWDANGRYAGQWQDNYEDEGLIFIGAPIIPPENWTPPDALTPEQMAAIPPHPAEAEMLGVLRRLTGGEP